MEMLRNTFTPRFLKLKNRDEGALVAGTLAKVGGAIGLFAMISFGSVAHADEPTSTVAGLGATAIGFQSTAVGNNASAGEVGTTALGATSTALGAYATASGFAARAEGGEAVATGWNSLATGEEATATGSAALATGIQSTATGAQASAFGVNSTATGALATAGGMNSTATGTSARAQGDSSTATGFLAKAMGVGSLASGAGSRATELGSVALGFQAIADGANNVALGAFSRTASERVNGTQGAVIAGQSFTFAGNNPVGTVSIGAPSGSSPPQGVDVSPKLAGEAALPSLQPAIYRTLSYVAAGRLASDSTDAVNGSQLFATNQALSFLAEQTRGATVTNPSPPVNTGVATGANATASGAGSLASATNSTALGSGAQATKANSVALGANSVATLPDSVSVGQVGAERVINNLAPGVRGTDAVNMNQLGGVQQQLNDTTRRAYSGIAGATALAMIPDVDVGKNFSIGAGAATFQGYAAMAVGVSARVRANWKVKAGVSMSGNGSSCGLGGAYQW